MVAADGSAQHTTIGAAVDAAMPGDTVLVRPGAYLEALRIDKDITVRGDGLRDQVLIYPPPDANPVEYVGAPWLDEPYPVYATIAIENADVTLGSMTVFRDLDGLTTSVWVAGGSPRLADVHLHTDTPYGGSMSLVLRDVVDAVVEDSEWIGYLYSDGSASLTIEDNVIHGSDVGLFGTGAATVSRNEFADGGRITGFAESAGDEGVLAYLDGYALATDGWGPSDNAVLSRIEGNEFVGGGVSITGGSDSRIEANTFRGVRGGFSQVPVEISGPETVATISGNRMLDTPLGVRVTGEASATIADNEFVDSNVAIAWYSKGLGSIEGNVISGGVTGIAVEDGSPEIFGNTIEGASSQGIAISSLTSPALEGNTVCGNGRNLDVSKFAEPEIGQNDICPDEPGG